MADIFIIWAKSDAHHNKIKGFILEKGMPGISTPKIEGKFSLRASITGQVVMEDVEIPEENLLPNAEGLGVSDVMHWRTANSILLTGTSLLCIIMGKSGSSTDKIHLKLLLCL